MLTLLDPTKPRQAFPRTNNALQEPDGLLAIGGCLSPERLINAYRHGIFPWFNAEDPILWWSPDPRLVLRPETIKISRSLRKILNREEYVITFDRAFDRVIQACASPGNKRNESWITDSMSTAYSELHRLHFAHSVEAWYQSELAGGLYGVAIGQVFFGESMFFRRSNASKAAFAVLAKNLTNWGYALIDCQVHTNHLESFGAKNICRDNFIRLIDKHCPRTVSNGAWISDPSKSS